MSASIKSSRQAAGEVKKAKKLEEAKKATEARKKSVRLWILGIALLLVAVALIVFVNGGILFRCTTAYTVNGTKYSPAHLSYLYGEQYYTFVNTYGDYAAYFGLDTTDGISSLDSQEYSSGEDGSEPMTWKDYFIDSAETSLTELHALCEYADANGITLTDEEIAEVDTELAELEETVVSYGYKNLNSYYKLAYGDGVNEKIVKELELMQSLGSKAYNAYNDSLTYTDEELEEYYQSLNGSADTYSYLYYFLKGEEVESTDAEGNVTSDVTDETVAEAGEKAESVKSEFETLFAAADADADIEELLNTALATQTDAVCSHTDNLSGSSLNSDYSEWLKDSSRVKGDATVIAASGGTGYYIIVFDESNDNHYPTVNVRHILIKAEADEDGNYTDEAIAAAHAEAEELLAQWQAGDATEDSFAEMANEYSEDDGSNTTGGLYENIYIGQMVDSFEEFCFAEHEYGDVGLVDESNSSYAGTHIIYYVGEGELYSNIYARDTKTSEDLNAWSEGLITACTCEEGSAMRFVG